MSPDETGESYDALTSEGGELCCLDAMWERIEPSQSPSTLWPPARIGHAGVSIGHRIYMYGGRDYINRVFQPGVWIFDTAKLEWTCPPMRAAGGVDMPRLRTGHCAIGHDVSTYVRYFKGRAFIATLAARGLSVVVSNQ